MTLYLLSTYTFSNATYPQLLEFEAGSGTEAARIRDRWLTERRLAIRIYAQRCKEASRRKEILGQMAFLHATVERAS